MASFVFMPSEDPAYDRKIRREAQAGRYTKVIGGVYVENTGEPVESLITREWYKLVGHLVPDGVVTDRTAIEAKPARSTSDAQPAVAHVFVSAPRSRNIINLPGLSINIREGAGPVEGDIPYLGTHLAGPVRALLDNLTPSRKVGDIQRTLGMSGVEKKLDEICVQKGADHLNHVRDAARAIAPKIGRETELKVLVGIVGSFLRTKDVPLETKQGNARKSGQPIDINRVDRFVELAKYLQSRAPQIVESRDRSTSGRQAGAFMEAYFSNYIEGTEFSVDEANDIIFAGRIPEQRPKDSHDVLATYLQLVDTDGRAPSKANFDEFVAEVRSRHARLMEHRPEILPGQFKTAMNRAGDTTFVAPELIMGTLKEGLGIAKSLEHPFHRAIFFHVMLAEVHPFNDGNGRLSRIFMSRELNAAGLSRIVVPTVYRDDYIAALRAFSRRNDPYPFVANMEFCQRVSSACSAADPSKAIETWATTFAFCEDPRNARLTMPNPALEIEERNGVYAPISYWDAVDPRPRGDDFEDTEDDPGSSFSF